jgi:hypothetical protein
VQVILVHVMVYVPRDLPVICLTVGMKDGLSIGVVDAGQEAGRNVRRRGDVRSAGGSTDASSRRCERLAPASVNQSPAGGMEATSSRRLRVWVVQDQSDRLDAWKPAESNSVSGRCWSGWFPGVLSPVVGRGIRGRHAARAIDIRGSTRVLCTTTLLAVDAMHGYEALGQGQFFQAGDGRDKRDQRPELGSELRGRVLRSLRSLRCRLRRSFRSRPCVHPAWRWQRPGARRGFGVFS